MNSQLEAMTDEELALIARQAEREATARREAEKAAEAEALKRQLLDVMHYCLGDVECEYLERGAVKVKHGNIYFTLEHRPYRRWKFYAATSMRGDWSLGSDGGRAESNEPMKAMQGAIKAFAANLAKQRKRIVHAQANLAAVRMLIRSWEEE
jgi:hypothetical protein